MGKKKMKIPSPFRNREPKNNNPWHWPLCQNPRTPSFRSGNDIFKTVNSVFFDPGNTDGVETPQSWFTNSSESASFSTESEDFDGESLETVVRGARSERLFFEPGESNSILEEAKNGGFPLFCKESVVLAMESEDPFGDFRRSMEEMVESYGVKDWECLEELLGWYLRVNGKRNHGFIVGAFVDLIVGISVSSDGAADSCADSNSFSSAVSTFSSSPPSPPSPLCRFEGGNEIHEEEKMIFS